MTDALVQFLRDRLDDDERAAESASPGPWHVNPESDEVLAVDDVTVADGFALSGQQLRATTEHIARHDPARVLAEVESKRWIVECHESWVTGNGDTICGRCGREHIDGRPGGHFPCQTLRLLALPYADHAEYQQDWKP